MAAESSEPPSDGDVQALLELSELTYRAITEVRRRIATVVLVLAVISAAFTLVCGGLWLSAWTAIDDVRDEALVEVLGVEIPDPRPAIERTGLRLRGLVFGIATAVGAMVTLPAVAGWLLLRPRRLPPALAARLAAGREPDRAD